MSRKALLFGLMGLLALGAGLSAPLPPFTQGQGGVQVPEIPGITVEDGKPQGCVDCHNRDSRLSVELPEEVAGHPDISGMAATQPIPDLCFVCHKGRVNEGGFAPALSEVLKVIHYAEPFEKNVFISGFGGFCTHCHSLGLESGEVTLKSGMEEQP